MSECPLCQDPECGLSLTGHLLACFDLTFDGQGDLGIGLVSGSLTHGEAALYDLLEALHQARLAWLQAPEIARPPVLAWIARDAALSRYFDALADRVPPGDDLEDQAAGLCEATQDRAQHARTLLADLVRRCGWDGLETDDVDPENPGRAVSQYALWWDREATRIGQEVAGMARTLMAGAGGGES